MSLKTAPTVDFSQGVPATELYPWFFEDIRAVLPEYACLKAANIRYCKVNAGLDEVRRAVADSFGRFYR
ncbi:MAG: hypothetical protein LW855_00385, partial [Alphaproteobacteria bacterium]|nr:hypothetical protein [Alphaproteobacteria bacterium]